MVFAVLMAGAAAAASQEMRVASFQMPISGQMSENLARMEDKIREGAAAGARVVVFPETALSGFTAAAVTRSLPALGVAMARLATVAAEESVYLIYGTAIASAFERPYNSAVVVGPDGREITRYHKMIPEPWFEPGDRPAYFHIDGVPCTLIICHDNRFPELVRLPALRGARVCFYISYEINTLPGALQKQENYRAQLIARAAENGIWIVQSNGIGPAGDMRQSLGYSRIVAPDGLVVTEAPGLQEAMLLETLDTARAGRQNALESLESKFFADWWKLGLEQMEAWEAGEQTAAAARKPKTRVRLALLQAMPVKWDLDANFEVFLAHLDEAKDADIFITPECWLDGYAAPDQASTPERLRGVAQSLESSPFLARVAQEADQRDMYICFGFTSEEGGAIYNAAGLWDRDGRLAGVYHKTHLQTHDLQYTAGAALPVWNTEFGAVGMMICADRRWPETARTLRLKGARLVLNPTYGMHHLANEWWMRTRGYENQCFIAFAHPETSFVVNPSGGLSGKRAGRPGVLLCDIDLGEAREDNHLRDRRPDLYDAITNE
jgi:predicted amidohydrolase